MKIGVLHGMENTFPPALVQRINAKNVGGLRAEAIRIGCIRMAAPAGYAVLVDRISHDVEFYRAYLKTAALTGTVVLNDPFRASAFDQFYACSLAAHSGAAVPRTAILPQKDHPPGTTVQTFRNLQFPLNWEEIFDYVGFPALFKPLRGGRWMAIRKVHSPDEFFAAYDQSGSAAMMLQQLITPREFYRCYVAGEEAQLLRYEPAHAHGKRYSEPAEVPPAVEKAMTTAARAVLRGLGFDISVVEFAVEDGTPYLVEVTHSALDGDAHSLGGEPFEWLVESVAQLAIAHAAGTRSEAPVQRELAARVWAR